MSKTGRKCPKIPLTKKPLEIIEMDFKPNFLFSIKGIPLWWRGLVNKREIISLFFPLFLFDTSPKFDLVRKYSLLSQNSIEQKICFSGQAGEGVQHNCANLNVAILYYFCLLQPFLSSLSRHYTDASFNHRVSYLLTLQQQQN